MNWIDYSTLVLTLLIPGLLSYYIGVSSRYKTNAGVTFDNKRRDLSLFTALMSLVASSLSGVSMIGIPSDVYLHGFDYAFYSSLGQIMGGILNATVFMPVLYNLDIVSAYEYFEVRFDHRVRKLASLLFIITQVFYVAIAVYPPASVISQYSAVSIDAVAQGLTIFCATCTVLGGFKGVVLTDTCQALMMWISILVFAAMAYWKGGGMSRILRLSKESGRLDMFVMDLDPTIRLSFWSGTFGIFLSCTSFGIVNPGSFQRYTSLKTEKTALWAVLFCVVQLVVMTLLMGFSGLGMYSSFYDCDPKSAGIVDNYLNNVIHFIDQSAGSLGGLRGIFAAGIISASLSTMSTNIDTSASMIYTELLKKTSWVSSNRTVIIRILSIATGGVAMAIVFLIKRAGSLLEIFQCFVGASGGLLVGLYILGTMFISANAPGSFYGGVSSLGIMSLISFGSRFYASNSQPSTKTLRTDGCPFNVTTPTTTLTTEPFDVPIIFRVTPHYYSLIAAVVTVSLGILLSWLTRCCQTGGDNDEEKLKREFFCPMIRKLFKTRFYREIPLTEIERPIKA